MFLAREAAHGTRLASAHRAHEADKHTIATVHAKGHARASPASPQLTRLRCTSAAQVHDVNAPQLVQIR